MTILDSGTIPVLIAGGGPVGLTLAIDLGRRGIPCLLAERNAKPTGLPKMERCNARTMEIYRRLGLADAVRSAGYPAHCPMDVFIVTRLTEPPILHLPYPSVDALKRLGRSVNDGSMPLEPYQLISQYTLEPLLAEAAAAIPGVTVRAGCELVGFEQDEDAVTATLRSARGEERVRARYLVGCDGGSSTVRKQLGFQLEGEGGLLELWQALFYCEDLYERIPIGKGRHYHVADDKNTQLIVQDSCRHFTLHTVAPDEQTVEARFGHVIGLPLPYRMLSANRWTQHLLVANRYRDRRVFIAGDAAHLMIPTGGLGMNTGIGDAIDLGWKLAGSLQGWGGPGLLESYERERRPIGLRNVAASRYASRGRRAWRSAWCPQIADPTPAGQAARENLARIADFEQRKTNELPGIELGYRYTDTPLIYPAHAAEGGPDPDSIIYQPSSWPGARLPHAWLPDGTALHDRLGRGYTLLDLQPAASGSAGPGDHPGDCAPLEAAFARARAPLERCCIESPALRVLYGARLLLLRPDLHIVWRGEALPADVQGLAAAAIGLSSG